MLDRGNRTRYAPVTAATARWRDDRRVSRCHQHIRNAREDAAGQVEREVAEVAHLVVDVVPEDVEEQHVADEVP